MKSSKSKVLGKVITLVHGNLNVEKRIQSHRTFLENQHGRPFIVLYTNMTVVTLCRNDLFLMLFEERSLLVSLCLHWVFLKVILKSENLNEIHKFSQAKRRSARRLIVYLKQ